MTNQIHNSADAIFTKNWNVYNKIIEHNYMFHNELATAISRILLPFSQQQPVRVLDLGCGDVALFSRLLAQYNVNGYVGYDTSAEVLRYAAASLQPMTFTHRLVNDYLQQSAKNESEPFNCIYSSFAIHHLTDEQKRQFFKEVYDGLLTPGGIFIYVDVLRSDDQPRSEYIDAYIQNITAKWTALNSGERTLVEEHIRAYDFPMEKRELKRYLEQTGFTVTEPAVIDSAHSILLLRK